MRHLGFPKVVNLVLNVGAIVSPKITFKIPLKRIPQLLNLVFGLFFKEFRALWVPLGNLLRLPKILLGGSWTPTM